MARHSTEELRELVPKVRETGFYVPQAQRGIDWSAYTANQILDIIDTLHFIGSEVDRIHAPRKINKIGRPATDAGVLAKILLFIELFHIPDARQRDECGSYACTLAYSSALTTG